MYFFQSYQISMMGPNLLTLKVRLFARVYKDGIWVYLGLCTTDFAANSALGLKDVKAGSHTWDCLWPSVLESLVLSDNERKHCASYRLAVEHQWFLYIS